VEFIENINDIFLTPYDNSTYSPLSVDNNATIYSVTTDRNTAIRHLKILIKYSSNTNNVIGYLNSNSIIQLSGPTNNIPNFNAMVYSTTNNNALYFNIKNNSYRANGFSNLTLYTNNNISFQNIPSYLQYPNTGIYTDSIDTTAQVWTIQIIQDTPVNNLIQANNIIFYINSLFDLGFNSNNSHTYYNNFSKTSGIFKKFNTAILEGVNLKLYMIDVNKPYKVDNQPEKNIIKYFNSLSSSL
jgi:hypothetical protein